MSAQQKAAAAELMETAANHLDALIMRGHFEIGLMSPTIASEAAALRDKLSQRVVELRDPERGLIVELGRPNRVRRTG